MPVTKANNPLSSFEYEFKLPDNAGSVSYGSELHEAVSQGNVNRVSELLGNQEMINFNLTRWCWVNYSNGSVTALTPYHFALQIRNPNIKKTIIALLKNAKLPYRNDWPTRMEEIKTGEDILKLLQKNGKQSEIDANINNPKKFVTLQFLMENINGNIFPWDIIQPVLEQNQNIISAILDTGAMHKKETLLHWAIYHWNERAIQYLVEKLAAAGELEKIKTHRNDLKQTIFDVVKNDPEKSAQLVKIIESSTNKKQKLQSSSTSSTPQLSLNVTLFAPPSSRDKFLQRLNVHLENMKLFFNSDTIKIWGGRFNNSFTVNETAQEIYRIYINFLLGISQVNGVDALKIIVDYTKSRFTPQMQKLTEGYLFEQFFEFLKTNVTDKDLTDKYFLSSYVDRIKQEITEYQLAAGIVKLQSENPSKCRMQ